MKIRELFESPTTTAVMAFGRMNPPTIGHAKLVDAIKSQPGDPFIFLSQSQKPKTDPLAFEDKLRYAKFFFPNVTIGNPQVKTIIQALQKVESLGYQQLIYVAGSDRVQAFEELLNKYNGKDFTFKSIKVVSAGERDPDADGAEGMSASKMRQAAADNDIESFKQGVPEPKLADEMFAAVRQGMGIKDAVPAESIGSDINFPGFKSDEEKKKKKNKKRQSWLDKTKQFVGLDEEAENPAVAKKITPLKMTNPPKAPDATIPRTRNGFTKDNGITYRQDKYDENIMHVETGSGDYTFDGARIIKWITPRIKGYRQIHDFVQRTIKVDADIEINTKDGPVMLSTDAVYDLEGNLKDAGSLSTSSGGAAFSTSSKNFTMDYTITDNLSIHVKGTTRPNKSKPSPEQIKAINDLQTDTKSLEHLITMALKLKKLGAKVTFKSPANQGAIPFNQGMKMLTQDS